jgi:hypothetical protein
LSFCCLFLMVFGGLAIWLQRKGGEHHFTRTAATVSDDSIPDKLESAEKVTREFIKEIDSAKRLQWVRKPEEVKMRLAEWKREARREW